MTEKKDRKSLYMSIVIAIIMISSAFAVILHGFGDSSESLRYGKYKFKLTNLGFLVKIDGKEYLFENFPSDVDSLNVSSGIKEAVSNSIALIITSDPNSSYKQEIALASYNIQTVLSNMDKQVGNAFITEGYKLPVFTCENATSSVPIVYIQESNVTEAAISGNCINLYFDSSYSLQRVSSAFLFNILGIIDGVKDEQPSSQ